MKKFILGIIVGALLAFSPQVYSAASSLVGKKIDGQIEVKLDGKQVGSAVVVEGTSYLPVRNIANELGLKIKVDKKEVTITSEEKSAEEEIAKLKKERVKVSDQLERDKANVESSLHDVEKTKERYEKTLAETNDSRYVDPVKSAYESSNKGHENLLKRIEDNEKELERIDNRLKELGAE
ncbi:hypothetical protein J27TS7_58970 [Paenibacillus dendritiformis]|uniref:stalk domain-containing protein n=1 Tax=Paenibacillus dendritiformis TaxID=130049 RepID=UPI001B15C02F|nr:stalk domain-containing protein [Paenibacillus dendritiformis]GIO76383.1 hypothetical protein J27TS7_58970 [Paenibacillus dendritiformis]